jgi:hypothetical protein
MQFSDLSPTDVCRKIGENVAALPTHREKAEYLLSIPSELDSLGMSALFDMNLYTQQAFTHALLALGEALTAPISERS